MSTWSCPTCTFVNLEDACKVCGDTSPLLLQSLCKSPSRRQSRDQLPPYQSNNQVSHLSPHVKPETKLAEVRPRYESPRNSSRGDDIVAQVLAMNCGFSVPEIGKAVQATGTESADLALRYLNGLTPQVKSSGVAGDKNKPSPKVKVGSQPLKQTLNDFVLREYIRDFAATVPDVLGNMDLFLVCMNSLDVREEGDRARAFALLELVKQEDQDRAFAVTLEKPKQRERQEGDLECVGCTKYFGDGGCILQNCPHFMCFPCLRTYVKRAEKEAPTCECGALIHASDVSAHVGPDQAAAIADRQTRELLAKLGGRPCLAPGCKNVVLVEEKAVRCLACSACRKLNCYACQRLHDLSPHQYDTYLHSGQTGCPMDFFKEHQVVLGVDEGANSAAHQYWESQAIECQLFPVARDSPEWVEVMRYYTGGAREIISVIRIQNRRLWAPFAAYVQRSRAQGLKVQEGRFWHGTRATAPPAIYQGGGFDMKHARIGGCLWFAVQSTYSMGGFQHPLGDGRNVVLQALVAHGNTNHVKFIRGNLILNVYENACTYPAYEITYR